MFRLVIGELRRSARVWGGVLVVSAGAAAAAALAAALITGARDVGGDAALALYAISGTVIAFTAVAGGVVLTSVGELTVSLSARSHALWLLVGVRPGAVMLVVLTQLAMVSTVGAVLGCLLATPVLAPFVAAVFADSAVLADVPVHLRLLGGCWVVVAVAALVVVSGVRPARRAGRVSGVELLRDPEPPRLRMGPGRWTSAGLAAVVVVSVVLSLRGRAAADVESPLTLVAPVTAAALVALGPVYVARLLRAWTARVPAGRWVAWSLARATAADAVDRSTAAVNPLVVTMALTGGSWTAHGAVERAVTAGTGAPEQALPAAAVLLLLGGPLLVGLLGSAATVAMSGRTRERDAALVQTAGGTGAVVLAAALGEAVALVGTALLLGTGAVGGTALVASWALGPVAGAGGLAAGVPALLVTAAGGLLLVASATVIPTSLALRRPPTSVLAAG